jgi:predicted nucleic acid-binding protein
MMNVCFDASALVSLFVGDAFGERCETYIETYGPNILVSDFAVVEFSSAINKLVRMEMLPASTAQGVFLDFEEWRRRAVTQVSLESRDLAAADGYLRRLDLNLRTGDAIHIAIAARVDASLATFDQRMAQVASLLGLDIAPA